MKLWKLSVRIHKPNLSQTSAASLLNVLKNTKHNLTSTNKRAQFIIIMSGAAVIAAPFVVSANSNHGTIVAPSESESTALHQDIKTSPTTETQPTGSASSQANISGQANAGASDSQASTNVTVNGEAMSVPANGSLHKVIKDGNSRTVVDVQNSQTGNSTTTTRTFSSTISSSGGGSVSVQQNSP